MYIDLHNHLAGWSPDAAQSWEELSAGMARAGLFGFGISDHYDLGSFTSSGREWTFDVDKYLATFTPYRRSLAQARADQAKGIKQPAFAIGIEIGYRQDYLDQIRAVMQKDFDYCLCSLHEIYGRDPYEDKDPYQDGLLPLYRNYLATISEALTALPEMSVLAHYDFISRYAPQDKSKMAFKGLEGEFEDVFQKLIAADIALEINTGTVAALIGKGYSLEEAMPDRAILLRYLDMGGRLFTLTTDSHSVEKHLRFIPKTLRYLASLGITQLCHFEGRKLDLYDING